MTDAALEGLAGKRVAIVHDWLVDFAGSERVLEQICALFPRGDLYTLVDRMPPTDRARIGAAHTFTSFLQRWPFSDRFLHAYLPLMPLAVQQFDLSAYDLVISSSHCVAKGVIVRPDALHLCYCHSPMRYAWDLQGEYLRTEGMERGVRSMLLRILLMRLRVWDAVSANGVDAFAANSTFVRQRIRRAYRRDAAVIHPPVDASVTATHPAPEAREGYVTLGRLIGYKNVELLVDAFRELPERRLTVMGDGPQLAKLRRCAPPNVMFTGAVDEDRKRRELLGARGFVFAATEDFGIAPVEALAHGLPVVAFARGGVRDYVEHGVNGWLVGERTPQAFAEGILASEHTLPDDVQERCIRAARRFASVRFRSEFAAWVAAEWARSDCSA